MKGCVIMKNTKVAASRFIVTVIFLILISLTALLCIEELVNRFWFDSGLIPLSILSLGSSESTGIPMSFILFTFPLIFAAIMTILTYHLMDLPTTVGVWISPFLLPITAMFLSEKFQRTMAFINIAIYIFVLIKLIGMMRKNPEAFNIQQNKSPSFTFYIIYAISTVAAFICFIIQRFHLNDIVQIVAGAILLLSMILLTYSAFWFLIHCGKHFLIRTLIFTQVVLYSAFYGINWHLIFHNRKIGITTVFIILFLLSGTISIWQYRKSINIKSSST